MGNKERPKREEVLEAIQNIAPEHADSIAERYDAVRDELDHAISARMVDAPETVNQYEAARDVIDDATQNLVIENLRETAKETSTSARNRLLEDFVDTLDDVSASLELTGAISPEVALAEEQAPGLGRRYETSDVEKLVNQFSKKQKLDMLRTLSESLLITPEQRIRLAQVAIIKTALETIKSDIKISRTWGEWFTQAMTEFGGTTEARVHRVQFMINSLDHLAKKITRDPNQDLNSILDPKIDVLFKGYKIAGLINTPKSFEELQDRYIALIKFLRSRKDYQAAQQLIEENLLGPYFAQKRKEIPDKKAREIRRKARAKIGRMVNDKVMAEWEKAGMTEEQQEVFIDMLTDQETERELNAIVAEMNNGYPFQLKGKEREILEQYRDMKGAGDWNIADEKWDFITEELIINAPLIIISGGAASVARASLSAGARALIAGSQWAARVGLAVTKTAEGAKVITATGRIGKSLYWTGRGTGLIAEGTMFEFVHSGLQGENLFSKDFPEWAKQILWSSATLGAFKIAGKMGEKLDKLIRRGLTKFPDESVRAAIQKLLITGNIETATVLAVGAIRHYMEMGNFDDYDFAEELFHALVAVGALKVVGRGIEVGGKKFFPPKEVVDAPHRPAEDAALAERADGRLARARRSENPEKITGRELLDLAAEKPRLVELLVAKMDKVPLTLRQFNDLLKAMDKAGKRPSTVFVLGALLKMLAVKKLASAANVRNAIANMVSKIPSLGLRRRYANFLALRLNTGSALAGIFVLLYAKPAHAARILFWDIPTPYLIAPGYLLIRYILSKAGLSPGEMLEKRLRRWTDRALISAADEAFAYAALNDTGRLLPATRQQRRGSPMEQRLRNSREDLERLGRQELADAILTNQFLDNYIDRVRALESTLSPADASIVRDYRTNVSNALNTLRQFLTNNEADIATNPARVGEIRTLITSLRRAIEGDEVHRSERPFFRNPVFLRWIIDIAAWLVLLESIGFIDFVSDKGGEKIDIDDIDIDDVLKGLKDEEGAGGGGTPVVPPEGLTPSGSLLPHNLNKKGFYYNNRGELERKGYNGKYSLNPDGSVIYTFPDGKIKILSPGADPNVTANWQNYTVPPHAQPSPPPTPQPPKPVEGPLGDIDLDNL